MADTYVNIDTGDDGTGDGSSGNPYQTFSKGLDEVADSSTLYLVPSTTAYTWTAKTSNFPVDVTISSTSTSPPDLLSGTNVVLDANSNAICWYLSGSLTCERIWFKRNHQTLNSGIYLNHIVGIEQVLQFTNCVFDDFKCYGSTNGRGGFIGNGPSVSPYTQTSIQVNADRCLFRNIKAYASGGESGWLMLWTGTFSDPNIRECTWYNDNTGYQTRGLITCYATLNQNINFRNFIAENDHADDAYPYRRFGGGASDVYYGVNCCWGNGVNKGSVTETDCITADPLFLDKPAGDFRLKPSSPCIDQGVLA